MPRSRDTAPRTGGAAARPGDSAPRFGMTVPYNGVSLRDHEPVFAELADLGYTDAWSSEVGGTDAFTPLALAAAWEPRLRLGCAVVPSFTRGPALLAMSVAAMAEAAPGRFCFGIGTSSNVIVEDWNGIPFEEPYRHTRDMIRFLRAALSGERVDESYDTFSVRRFRLERPPEQPPPILVGALRPGMLHLAGREGDGAVINWLSAQDVRRVVAEVGDGKEIVARIFVCPSTDTEAVRRLGRTVIASYLNVPVYAAFHRWLGRGPLLQPMWDSWSAGDRKAAAAAIPDRVVDELIVHGTPEECRAHVQRYLDNGVSVPALMPLPLGTSYREAVKALAPSTA